MHLVYYFFLLVIDWLIDNVIVQIVFKKHGRQYKLFDVELDNMCLKKPLSMYGYYFKILCLNVYALRFKQKECTCDTQPVLLH